MYSIKMNINFGSIYFNFFTTNLLGPFTHKLENVAVKSGPCLKWIFSRYSGSSGIVLNPSPKSPIASGCLIFSTSSKIHFSGFAKFREHGVIDDAVEYDKIKEKKTWIKTEHYTKAELHAPRKRHRNIWKLYTSSLITP